MLTGNKDLLNRYGALKKQIADTKKEIDIRVESEAVDNDGYKIVYLDQIGQYMIMNKDFQSEV